MTERWRIAEPAEEPARIALRSRARRLRHLRLLLPDAARVGYLGWLGHRNVGDIAVFEACEAALRPLRVVEAPSDGRLLARLRAARGRPLFRAAMLGGGTLIGTRAFRVALESIVGQDRDMPLMMLGSGVEDPGYEAPYARGSQEELGRWKPLLERFERVAVRGPRSAELVHGLGVQAEVVGDAALLLRPHAPPPPRRGADAPVVAVNLGVARHIYGGHPESLLEEVARGVLLGSPPGARHRVISVWPRDDAYAAALADRLGPGAALLRHADDPQNLVEELARCDLAVGLKLHFLVLAAAAGTPGIMLSYHPKCEDFQRSIGGEASTIRTDEVRAGALAELIADGLKHREARAAALQGAVEGLRSRLRAHAASCRSVAGAA